MDLLFFPLLLLFPTPLSEMKAASAASDATPEKNTVEEGKGGGEVEEKESSSASIFALSRYRVDFFNPSILVAEAFAHSKE